MHNMDCADPGCGGEHEKYWDEECPVNSSLKLIGGKWKLAILYNLLEQTKRFGELRRALPQVTQKMLTQQLRELEANGLISRKIYAEVPPKVEYTITPIGRKLEPILSALCQWGTEYRIVRGMINHEVKRVTGK